MNLTARDLRHIQEFGRLTASDSLEGYQITVTALFHDELLNGEPVHLGQYKYCLMKEGHIIDAGMVQGLEECHPSVMCPRFVKKFGVKNEQN